jgi:hypothetical protein
MDMKKPDRSIADRATPEMTQWLETVDRNARQQTVLARAREAHEAVWQQPRTQQLFSSVAGGAARQEDFSFFFYSAPANGVTAVEDDATAKRLRRLQMLKLMLQQAQLAKGLKNS